jgi:hypothetical protein
MANPLKVRSSGATFQGLQTMTDAEMDYAIDVILKNFAATNTGLGTVNIDGATGTSIGTFTDTSRSGTVGDHPVTDSPTTVATYTFKQDITTAATESLTRPVEYSSTGVRQQNDTQLNDSIINRALTNLTTSGIGSYVLQPSAPIGTWTSIGSITNSVIGATNTSTLWRKTGGTAPTTVRPLKYQTSPTKSVQQMTDAEIQSLTNRLRNRIIATNRGIYRLQTSAPSPGTWTTAGAAFNDTRNALATPSYVGSYTGSFTGTYTGNFAGTYVPAFTGFYSRAFTGFYAGAYQRFFSGFSGGFFTGSYTGFFTSSYAGTYQGIPGNFAGVYAGTYSRTFAGAYTAFFSGFTIGTFTGFYTGFFSGTYTGFYSQTGFSGTYSRNFSGAYSGTYSGAYAGVTIQASTDTISTVSLWVRTA